MNSSTHQPPTQTENTHAHIAPVEWTYFQGHITNTQGAVQRGTFADFADQLYNMRARIELPDPSRFSSFPEAKLAIKPIKEDSGYIIRCGMHNGQREATNAQPSAIVAFDLDGITDTDLASMWSCLKGVACVVHETAAHRYAQHFQKLHRLRVYVLCERPIAPGEYKQVWGVLNARLFNGKADKGASDPARAMFLAPEGAQFWGNANGAPVPVPLTVAPLQAPGVLHELQGLNEARTGSALEEMQEALRSAREIPDGHRDKTMTAWAGAIAQAFPSNASTVVRLLDPRQLGVCFPGPWQQGSAHAELAEKVARLQRQHPAAPVAGGLLAQLRTAAQVRERRAAAGPVRWVCEGLQLTAGRPNMLVGPPTSGKTIVAQDIALAVANGTHALGSFPCNRGRVVHLDFEQGEQVTFDRYERLSVSLPQELAMIFDPCMSLADKGVEPELTALCTGTSLLVIDSLSRSLPRVDENSSEIGEYLGLLARISNKTGCAILVLHHDRKGTKEADGSPVDPQDQIRGSTAIPSQLGVVWKLSGGRREGQPRTLQLIRPNQRARGPIPDARTLQIEDTESGGLRVRVDEPAAPENQQQRLGRISWQVRSAGVEGTRQTALRDALNMKTEPLRADLAVLVASGEIIKKIVRGKALYFAPDLGAAVALQEQQAAQDRVRKKETEAAAYKAAILSSIQSTPQGFTCEQIKARHGGSPKPVLEALTQEGLIRPETRPWARGLERRDATVYTPAGGAAAPEAPSTPWMSSQPQRTAWTPPVTGGSSSTPI
jgi:hypothetical protein